jgi:hypothetical protein
VKFVLWGGFLSMCAIGLIAVLGALAPEDIRAVAAAQATVSAELRDPGSAHFSGLGYHKGVVCGRVNAKNGFGGYSGDRRFIVTGGSTVTMEPETYDSAFEDQWTQHECYLS